MKKITRFIFMAFAAALMTTACAPQEFDDYSLVGADHTVSPEQVSFDMTPGSNVWTFNYTASIGVDAVKYPYTYEIRFGDGTTTKNLTGSHEFVVAKGNYTAQILVYTPNGNATIKEKTITITEDNPKTLGPDPLFGSASKTWVVDGYNKHVDEVRAALPGEPNIKGFMGLGPVGNNQEWWGAGPGDKSEEIAGWTLYDCKWTFTFDGQLTIETNGEGYGRKASASIGGFTVTGEEGDDMLFSYDGGDYTYTKSNTELTISDNGYLTYYCGVQTYEILYLSESAMCVRVVSNPEGHNWVFILCPDGEQFPDAPIEGNWVDVDSNDNLWKGVSITNSFWYAPGWNQIADPELTINGTQYTISLPEATSDQWQCQCNFLTAGLTTSAAENYDFRVTIRSSNEFTGATVKFVQEGDDNNFLFDPRVKLLAKENIISMVNVAGKDISQAKIVFDFGGNPANTEILIKDIILQKHRD